MEEKYSKKIYVQIEDADDDNGYLMAYRDTDKDSVSDGEVAIYEFVGMAKKTTNIIIQ